MLTLEARQLSKGSSEAMAPNLALKRGVGRSTGWMGEKGVERDCRRSVK